MSAEPKVLLEFRNKYGEPAHIVQLANGERRVEAQMDRGDRTEWIKYSAAEQILIVYDALEARHARVREAAERLVAKLDAVEQAIAGAFSIAAIHGMPYSGPNYADDLSDLRAALETP